MSTDFYHELSPRDRDDLGYDGIERYAWYRRKGWAPADCVGFARAWIANRGEQRDRRLDHDTGAIDWRDQR